MFDESRARKIHAPGDRKPDPVIIDDDGASYGSQNETDKKRDDELKSIAGAHFPCRRQGLNGPQSRTGDKGFSYTALDRCAGKSTSDAGYPEHAIAEVVQIARRAGSESTRSW